MSKSGLYAHFKSKEELELATIETAAEIFEREVLAPARDVAGRPGPGAGPGRGVPRPPGAAGVPGRLLLRDRGGSARVPPGRPRDRVTDMLRLWQDQFAEALREAVAAGELPRRRGRRTSWCSR